MNTIQLGMFADAGAGDHMSGFGWGMMGFGWLAMVAIMFAVIWAVVRLVVGSSPKDSSSTDSAARILADRFARGDIDSAEYHERLSELDS